MTGSIQTQSLDIGLPFEGIEEAAFNAVFLCPLGLLGLRYHGEKLTELRFVPDQTKQITPDSVFVKEVVSELEAYFRNPGAGFLLDLEAVGTEFQKRVWAALLTIPVGETLTYGALAQKIGSSARAVGGACRRNPIPVIVPCHRVVAANGPGGYAGATDGKLMDIKNWLLAHEART